MKMLSDRRIQFGIAVLLTMSLLLDACGPVSPNPTFRPRQDAERLLQAIHSTALGEEDTELAEASASSAGHLQRLAAAPSQGSIDELKAWIQMLQADCASERAAILSQFPEEAQALAISSLDNLCQQEIGQLRGVLDGLRAARNRRGWFRRTILGRALSFVWRRVIKNNIPIIVLGLAAGSGEFIKHFLIERGRSALQREARTYLGRQLARRGVRVGLLELVGLSPGRWPPNVVASDEAESPSPGSTETQETAESTSVNDELIITAEVTEEDMTGPSSAVLTWFQMDQEVGAESGWCEDISASALVKDLQAQLQIDLHEGTAVGTFSATFECRPDSADCNDPGEFVNGRLEGEIVDGWARPDGKGGWEWGGTVDAQASMSAKRVCVRIDSPDHPSEYIWAQGSTSKQIAGFLSGDSWGFPGGYEGLWFDLGGPDAVLWEGRPHLHYDIHCVRPSCPLPRSVPAPP
jgi:hypothetical protein